MAIFIDELSQKADEKFNIHQEMRKKKEDFTEEESQIYLRNRNSFVTLLSSK